MVDGLGLLFRYLARVHGAAAVSESRGSLRLALVIYYPAEQIPNGDLARRLEGLEWWITDRETIPPITREN